VGFAFCKPANALVMQMTTSNGLKRPPSVEVLSLVMVALCNRADHYIFILFLLSSVFSSPNLSGRRLDVYHTLAHGVALVRI